ncbi:MAG: class I SAM-dependent methyltransferase [Chloroflexota bacterium]
MSQPTPSEWTSQDSDLYKQLAAIAVPRRAEQIATVLTLIPFDKDDAFCVVELASGEGYLSAAILEAFPHATVTALDYEESMREATSARLEAYAGRWTVARFDIKADDWFGHLDSADVVVSSLCVHHLDDAGKQGLFNAVGERVSDNGALLIADLVLPQNGRARELFATTWDSMAEAASIERTLARDTFQLFVQEQWNYYRYPDDFDTPSPLYHQLRWIDEAGFSTVDVFWMQAGHAVYGGYMSEADTGLEFEYSLKIAQEILKT